MKKPHLPREGGGVRRAGQRPSRALLPSLLFGCRAALNSLKAKSKCEVLGVSVEQKTPSASLRCKTGPACWMPSACPPFPGPPQAGLLDAVRSNWYPGASWACSRPLLCSPEPTGENSFRETALRGCSPAPEPGCRANAQLGVQGTHGPHQPGRCQLLKKSDSL